MTGVVEGPADRGRLELWGGIECTVARVGELFRNQVVETGHARRLDDLDRIAGLGIRTLRYPVLWEQVAPEHPDRCEWAWHDERLSRLRTLGVRPIAGLLHHGSGPAYTSLLDPELPRLLSVHAGRVAQRYPWLELYTPVNEPLTTARFSGLYGHWYPHARDQRPFLTALVHQCLATLHAMRAIRRVRSDARLVQTEDLGKVFAMPTLQARADYENERRWLSLDLLCGRVDRHHPWYRALRAAGIGEAELDLLGTGQAAPDIIGINHYLTSERFLDDRLALYPPEWGGGSDGQHYADVEATRVAEVAAELGPKARLAEAWARYGRPLAITEAHHGSTRDEQLRWLDEVWRAALALRADGVDLRAVTIWALFGLVDWSSLLTRTNGHYEPGAFDVRSAVPRPTALATAAATLARGDHLSHPVLDTPGWWRRPERGFAPRQRTPHDTPTASGPVEIGGDGRQVLVIAGRAALTEAVVEACAARALRCTLIDPGAADPGTSAVDPSRGLRDGRFWVVIDTRRLAGQTSAAAGMIDLGSRRAALVLSCAAQQVPYVACSSARVFDGALDRAYLESDLVSAECAHGAAQGEIEGWIGAAHPRAMIVRAGALFGPADSTGFAHCLLRRARRGRPAAASARLAVTPSYLPDLADAMLDLLIDGACGVWHLANDGQISWHEFASRILEAARIERTLLVEDETLRTRPRLLDSERGRLLPPLTHAMARFASSLQRAA